jgi:hypothetical protein
MKTMICFENLSYSQFNHEVTNEINKYTLLSNEEICISSLDQSYPFTNINTAVFSPLEMDSFNNGVIIANTIRNAENILGCSNNSKKVLYLFDLDWMFYPMFYDDIYNILTEKNIKLILRSEDHIRPIYNICKRKPDAVLNRFSLEGIWNLL